MLIDAGRPRLALHRQAVDLKTSWELCLVYVNWVLLTGKGKPDLLV
jgi:hypothetical protein